MTDQIRASEDQWAFVNGEYLPAHAPLISIFDHGFLYGDGVFDTLAAKYGYIFKLEAHLARFERSMKAIGLEVPYSTEELRTAVLEVLRRSGIFDHSYIKLVATRGVSAEPLLDPRGCKPTVVIFARPDLHWAPPELHETGMTVKLATTRRVAVDALDPRIKSLNYLNLVLARMEAIVANVDEALLLDEDGYVCEGPGYNVFAVIDGVVTTPGQSILAGVTRATVLELCAELPIPSAIAPLSTYSLFTADEVFFTGTATGLIPVTKIDGRTIGTGRAGLVFERIDSAYEAMLRSGKNSTPIRP
jgi:branched-chain amino acid aminotransferase